MLQRYQIKDRGHRNPHLFDKPPRGLQFAIFVATQPYCACLIPTFGALYTEMQQWSEAKIIGTYDRNTNPMDIVADVYEDAEWVLAEQRDRVHYHRHPDGIARAYSVLRRET